VDVNVHPRKAEVRFLHERLVYGALAAALRDALAEARPPSATAGAFARWPADAGARAYDAWPPAGFDASAGSDAAPRGRDLIAGARPAPMLSRDAFAPAQPDEGALAELGAPASGAGHDATGAAAGAEGAQSWHDDGASDHEARASERPSRLGALRALGQVALTYIVAEGDDGLVLIDQHAAHERVLYERVLAARAAGAPASQPLLAPAIVELGPSQAALAAELAGELAAVGWAFAPADGRALILRALPVALARLEPARALREQLDRLEAEERLSGPDRVAASLACRAAVMAGDRLEEAQQRALLRALEQTATPQTCPHGRPTVLRFSREAIERSFARR
jgi:DNA mismatch repair protein MutL